MKKCKRLLAVLLIAALCMSSGAMTYAEDADPAGGSVTGSDQTAEPARETADEPQGNDQQQTGDEQQQSDVPQEENQQQTDGVQQGNDQQTDDAQQENDQQAGDTPQENDQQAEGQQVQTVIDFAYVENNEIAAGEKQNVVISLLDKNASIEAASLEYQGQNTQSLEKTEMVQSAGGTMLFNPDTQNLESYKAMKLYYTVQGIENVVELAAEGIDAGYVVKEQVEASEETAGTELEDAEDIKVEIADENGNVTTVGSIEEGIEAVKDQETADSLNGKVQRNVMAQYYRSGPAARSGQEIVIVLDPGHDGTHAGAGDTSTGIREEVYTLLMAQACKAELEKHQGVKVYMTRNSAACPFPGTTSAVCNKNRTDYAKSVGADIFVSFHLNSAGTTAAKGAEVYVSNYSKYNSSSQQIGAQILKELAALGLSTRGVKVDADDHDNGTYDDGNWKDDLTVIRNSVLNGFPAILIEHGFIGNANDSSIIKNRYTQIGQADARALIAKLGLVEKAQSVTINGITVGKMDSSGQIKLTANVSSSDKGLKYQFQVYDMASWYNVTGATTNKTATWTPKKTGDYLVNLNVWDSKGKLYQHTIGTHVTVKTKKLQITGFAANKTSPQAAGTTIALTGKVANATSGVTYEYLAYDGKYWSKISSSKTLGSVNWKPSVGGSYLLCFQVITSSGEILQQFTGFQVNEPKVTINGITVGSMNSKGQIPLAANVTTNDPGLKYQFKVYDMKDWSALTGVSTSKSAVWTPKSEGVYLLYLEVTSSTGRKSSYAMGWQINGATKITGFSANKAYPQKAGTTIKLQGSVSTMMPAGLTYEYLAYDGAYWSMISSSKTLGSVSWTPKSGGNYLLCFQVKKADGAVIQQFMGYSITDLYARINGINQGSMNSKGQIPLTANVSTNDSGLKYQYKAYDMSDWVNVTGVTTSGSATWNPPSEGVYLLYLEVTMSNGKKVSYAMGAQVINPVNITSFTSNYKSPQKVNTAITLNAKASAGITKNLRYEYLAYDGAYWSMISSSKTLGSATWTPKQPGDYLLCFQVITGSGRAIQSFMGYTVSPYYNVMGTTTTSAKQMAAFFMANNGSYDKYTKVSGYDGILKKGGAANITAFCQMYIDEANAEGVKAEVAFAQAMLETGFLKFGGDVKPGQYNFAGLGAVGNGAAGNSFKDVRTGIRAQIQHLKCYASTAGLNQSLVDPRWSNSLRGKAPYVEWLSIPNNPNGTGWAADKNYADKLLSYITSLHMYSL